MKQCKNQYTVSKHFGGCNCLTDSKFTEKKKELCLVHKKKMWWVSDLWEINKSGGFSLYSSKRKLFCISLLQFHSFGRNLSCNLSVPPNSRCGKDGFKDILKHKQDILNIHFYRQLCWHGKHVAPWCCSMLRPRHSYINPLTEQQQQFVWFQGLFSIPVSCLWLCFCLALLWPKHRPCGMMDEVLKALAWLHMRVCQVHGAPSHTFCSWVIQYCGFII